MKIQTPLLPNDIQLFIKLYEISRTELIKTIVEKETGAGGIASYERNLLMQVEENIIDLNKEAARQGKKLTEKYYKQGINAADKGLAEYKIPQLEVSFSKIHKPALTELVKNLNDNLSEANYFVGRKIKDEIRETCLKAVSLKLSTGKTVEEAIRMLKTNFLIRGLSGFKDTAGRTWNLDAYAGMAIRSTTREATNSGTLNQLTGLKRDLVKVSQHNSPCPICSVYEGRVFSISGKDKNYPPLSAMFADGFNNIHPNCRHVLTPYIEKYEDYERDRKFSKRPFDIPPKDAEKLKGYYEEQNEKRKLRVDKEQYERYRILLKGKEEVLTFRRFRKAKEDEETWKELKSEYRSKLEKLKPPKEKKIELSTEKWKNMGEKEKDVWRQEIDKIKKPGEFTEEEIKKKYGKEEFIASGNSIETTSGRTFQRWERVKSVFFNKNKTSLQIPRPLQIYILEEEGKF